MFSRVSNACSLSEVSPAIAEFKTATAALLSEKVKACGNALQTGFVGTPYLLFALSRNGYQEQAYDLLLRKEYPGWLYSVNKGATTIWEHWDGIKEDGSFWDISMNSFNHYGYGSVIGWLYEEAAGIQCPESAPGYKELRLAPHPDRRLGWLEAKVETKNGTVFSGWKYEGNTIRYEFNTPVKAQLVLDDEVVELTPGEYVFFKNA